ncbi:zinc finger protein ZAT4-like [Macadamia integrifolia]|uniref:zinc finger protein ZAT4-like n=1 Tax=Macadamia integrifolia TaxID=60698 RepID=UPI001C4E539E|nr:zinc finger protein ZAT4-like [Macadamia integrifolia]
MAMALALVVDQQPSFKYYCRICKKGFGCGRALGGHMRAHGIGDSETGNINDEDRASDWEDKLEGGNNLPPGTKRMYALRTNPNRLKNCRICENCGKEFSSWKSFLVHGKCSSNDAESLVSSRGSDDDDNDVAGRRGCGGWSKGKRSKRLKLGNSNSSEEEDLAHCLVMLSTARVDPLVAETEESCASASKDEERRNVAAAAQAPTPAMRGMFECKACKKVFNSHQALGGHRASHKKVKGCFAAKLDDLDESLVDEDVITHDDFSILPCKQASHPPLTVPSKRKSKVHECSICHRVFSSGQALGGHKRCHWITSNSPDTSSIPKFHQISKLFNRSETLDLNLPAPVDDIAGIRLDPENPLSFEAPTAIYLQPWNIGVHSNHHDQLHHQHHHHHRQHNNDNLSYTNSNNNTFKTNNNANTSGINVDDEADSKVKLAKLSDLKDMNLAGSSSPWLQVGIGSTANWSGDP